MKKIFLLLFITLSFSGCEKDDICDENTSTTPNVVIEFYDTSSTTTLKTVTNLGVFANTMTTGLPYTGVSKIKLPLDPSSDTVTFHFIQNGSDTNTTNDITDDLVFNYTRNTLYVSRACGYKITYNLLNTNSNLLLSHNWINHVEIKTTNIENENEIHLKIFY